MLRSFNISLSLQKTYLATFLAPLLVICRVCEISCSYMIEVRLYCYVILGRQIMKQKHDELKAAIERGIVDSNKAVGENDGRGIHG